MHSSIHRTLCVRNEYFVIQHFAFKKLTRPASCKTNRTYFFLVKSKKMLILSIIIIVYTLSYYSVHEQFSFARNAINFPLK